jgi:hypothetical protein
VAVIPAAAGITALGEDLSSHFDMALTITAVLSLIGGVVAFATIRQVAPVESVHRASPSEPCENACLLSERGAAVASSAPR